MATIGNTDNILPVARDLMELADTAKSMARQFAYIGNDGERYGLTDTQKSDAVSELDVASVQDAFNTAKATFIATDPV